MKIRYHNTYMSINTYPSHPKKDITGENQELKSSTISNKVNKEAVVKKENSWLEKLKYIEDQNFDFSSLIGIYSLTCINCSKDL